jgi:hypothetical protein
MSAYMIWSQAFLPEEDADFYTCFLEEIPWRQIHDRMSDAKRIFASIRAGERVFVCALGHPIRAGGLRDPDSGMEPLYLPQHLLNQIGIEGSGETLIIDWITEEYAPHATKLVLKPHDPMFFQVNARDELEPALTRYGILKSGTTIPVPLEALDGIVVSMDVVRCEPADLVLMEGDEVEIEFESEVTAAAAAVAAPLEPDDCSMVPPPLSAVAPSQGNILGGAVRPRLPDGRAWNPWRAT